MTDPQEPTPSEPASEPTADVPSVPAVPQPETPPAAPPMGTAWGGPPTAPPAGWGPPTPPVTPPPAPPAGWSQPGPAAPGWAMTAAPAAQPHGSLPVTLAGIVLLVIGILVGLAGVGLMAVGLVARAAFETALQNADPVGYSVDAVRVFEGIVVILGVIVGLYGLGELIAAIGVLLKRQWGRLLGILLSFIAGLLTTLVALGTLGSSTGTTRGAPVFFIVFAVAYWFVVVALARGGQAFRRG
jgi:hypothetical protein